MADKEALWEAFLAGFKQSAEGWNGEFPWYNGEEKQEQMKEYLRESVNGFEEWYEEFNSDQLVWITVDDSVTQHELHDIQHVLEKEFPYEFIVSSESLTPIDKDELRKMLNETLEALADD